MKMVCAVVYCQGIRISIERKSSMCNPIRISTDDRAEVSRPVQISFQRVVAQHHVINLSLAIRCLDHGNNPAVISNLNFQPTIIDQREELHLPSVGHDSKLFATGFHELDSV